MTTSSRSLPARGAPSSPAASSWTLAGLAFAALALATFALGRNAPQVATLGITFVSIVLEALPFVMLGALIGGLIEIFVPRERVSALLAGRRPLGAVFVAAGLGIIIPVCECAVIPITRRLVRKGVPFSVAVAYLLGGPIVNPVVAASTAVAYAGSWPMVATRLAGGFVIAVAVALLVGRFFSGHAALLASPDGAPGGRACSCACVDDLPAGGGRLAYKLLLALEQAADDFLNVSQFLVAGAFVAALSQTLVPRAVFLDLASTPAAAILVMMALALVLNLCSEADAFVAASFRASLPPAAQLAFMLLGPMLDLKLIAMYLSFVRKRALTLLIVAVCGLVFGLTMLVHALPGEMAP